MVGSKAMLIVCLGMDNNFWERVDAWRKDPTLFKPVRWHQVFPGAGIGIGLFVGYVAVSYVWNSFGPRSKAIEHGHHDHGHSEKSHH